MKGHRDFGYVRRAMRLGKQKLVSAIILLCCLTVLGTARWLKPDPRGYGTHQQLHLPPCAFQALTGLPCVTCGMTTSFAFGVRGEWRQAFATQPFGLLLFFVTIGLAMDSAVALATDRSVRNARLPWRWIIVVLAVLAALAWGYRIFQAW
jgi:hypothetical protein